MASAAVALHSLPCRCNYWNYLKHSLWSRITFVLVHSYIVCHQVKKNYDGALWHHHRKYGKEYGLLQIFELINFSYESILYWKFYGMAWKSFDSVETCGWEIFLVYCAKRSELWEITRSSCLEFVSWFDVHRLSGWFVNLVIPFLKPAF